MKAIHSLIIELRRMTYHGVAGSNETIEFLDKLEYLQALIIEDEDHSSFFDSYLEGLCEKFNLSSSIITKYRSTDG
ncbi:MAG: hypothetical protein AAGF89_13790 [Bacteroidota bacterium]